MESTNKEIMFIKSKREREKSYDKEDKNKKEIYSNKKESFPNMNEEYFFLKTSTEYWDKIKKEKNIPLNKNKYKYGNYSSFYYKRYLNSFKEKEIKSSGFMSEWFENKKCLDIGCNIGTLTILIAENFSPSYIEGVDIDYHLIKEAINTTKSLSRNAIYTQIINSKEEEKDLNNNLHNLISQFKQLPKSFQLQLKQKEKNTNTQIFSNSPSFNPNRIFFRQENFVAQLNNGKDDLFDTIICLGTSKWIHLNYGDIGIKVMFYNIYQLLQKGGILIFEPQRFESYKKKLKLSFELKKNFKEIKFKPETFITYLTEVYKMKLVNTITLPSNSKKIYYRMIYILEK